METNIFTLFENALSAATSQILLTIISFIPTFLGAITIFIVGLLLAGWAKSLVVKIINVTKISEIISNPAIKEFLKNAQVNQKIEVVIGEVVRWLIIALFFTASINILGLTTVTNFLNTIFSYIPTLSAAIFILLIGVLLAGILEKVVKGSIGGVDVALSRLMGKIVSYSVMIISVLAAISQMGIAQNFIELMFTGFIATITIALGLGLGLGSKDIIKEILEDWYKNYKKK